MSTYSKDLTDNLLARKLSVSNKAAHVVDISTDAVKASGVLTGAVGDVSEDETITIGTTVITIELAAATANSIVSATDLSVADTCTSIKEFINGEIPTVATVSFNARTFDESVSATKTATTVVITERTGGLAGNAVATTETLGTGSFAAVTLVGGLQAVFEADAITTDTLISDGVTTSATYADDTAAGVGGVAIGDIYRVTTTGVVQWRVS
jgi:hypothetical protein